MDTVDHIIERWRRERPDLDVSPMAVIGRLSRLSRILERAIEVGYTRRGLQGGRFSVLAALRRAGPPYTLSASELWNSLLISSGAMTNRLERLQEEGLIVRELDPRDRRYARISLSRKGLQAIDQALTDHVANEHELLSPLTTSERLILAELLRKLLCAFDDVLPARERPPAVSRR